MDQVPVLLGAFFAPLLIGVAVPLTALIPSLRAGARSGARPRFRHAALGALLAFILTYGVCVVTSVELSLQTDLAYAPMDGATLVFQYDSQTHLSPESQAHVAAARSEFWFREAIPTSGPACYTGADACHWADTISQWNYCRPGDGKIRCEGILPYVISGLISAAIASALIVWLTRRVEADPAPSADSF